MDSWTDDQIAAMLAGGNSRWWRYLDFRGMERRGSSRDKYDSEAGRQYREDLKRRAASGEQAASDGGPVGSSSGDPPIAVPKLEEVFEEVDKSPSRFSAFVSSLPVMHSIVVGDLQKSPPLRFAVLHLSASALVFRLIGAVLSEQPWGRWIAAAAAAGISLPVIKTVGMAASLSGLLSNHRHAAFKSARNHLVDLMKSGRAERRGGYDLYSPPPSPSDGGGGKKPSVPGFILIPGAAVEHTAYSFVASAIADTGVVVAVLNLEPLRISPVTSDTKSALKVMYEVISLAEGFDVSSEGWAVGGHSIGAAAAHNLALSTRPGVSKLVQWGAASGDGRLGSLREGRTPVDVLVINASEDAYANKSKEKRGAYERFKKLLPPEGGGTCGRTTYVEIQGGNHSGYGHYGPQLTPIPDGTRTITLDEQQKIVVRETADFLLGRSKGKGKKD